MVYRASGKAQRKIIMLPLYHEKMYKKCITQMYKYKETKMNFQHLTTFCTKRFAPDFKLETLHAEICLCQE